MEANKRNKYHPYSNLFFSTILIITNLTLISTLCSCTIFSKSTQKQVMQKSTSVSASPSISEEFSQNPASSPKPENTYSIIDAKGSTLETRILPPEGFGRIPSGSKEFAAFTRGLTLKEDNCPVLLYDGKKKRDQSGHAAVFDLDIGKQNLQQCADSIIRVYSEYYWSHGQTDKIAFHLTNGFLMDYPTWRDGSRLQVSGNDVKWVKTKSYDNSYNNFRSYLNMVYSYAGTLSLSQETKAINIGDIRPGDMFLQGGSPGHCVLVLDIAEDSKGNRCFLLGQGYMPAQDFHVLKNPLHPEDPWYYASEITFPLTTPSWTFKEGSLCRWTEFPLNKAKKATIFTNNKTLNRQDVSAMPDKVISPEDNTSRVNLLAVGDNLIHSEIVQDGLKSDGTYNFDSLYANLKDEISAADIAIINQETILGGKKYAYTGYPSFNSPTEIGDSVRKAGFDVVLHATNHTMDKGWNAVTSTLSYWNQYPEITVLGIHESEKERNQIQVVEKNGIRIAMLNYTYGLNGCKVPENMPYLVNILNKEQMRKDIKKAETLADFTIVFPHWGTEYIYTPAEMQEDLTRFFYENGVDLVIGTHPHVLEPVEWIGTGTNHRMLVYYSLGNFISYQKEAPRMLGGMAEITLVKERTCTTIDNACITPIVTHYSHGHKNFSIYKLSDYSEKLASAHGVSEIAQNGTLTYRGIYALAKQILGPWFQ